MKTAGHYMHALANMLWPLNRSITGQGVRESLAILAEHLPTLLVHEVPSGTKCFDWTVPREWRIGEAWIKDSAGNKVVDFAHNNLHLVGYSTPVNVTLSLGELQKHLYSIPDQPDAIPYITSYYYERWGFCITQNERDLLQPGLYHVYIDSELFNGSLTYGEVYIPGETDNEILLSTYICHPSMANNELSGPCVATWLGRWLNELPQRKFSYRILFLPETIGSIFFLSKNLNNLKSKLMAGFVLTCLGDDRAYSYLPSLDGDTLADRVAKHVLHHVDSYYKVYSFLDRGSDERQYCSPGVDLPVCSIMRSKYGEYPEYHTSLDNLELITPTGLEGSFNVYKYVINCLEENCIPSTSVLCEPELGRRGLYPSLSTLESASIVRDMMNLIAYSDGNRSLFEIAEIIDLPMWKLVPLASKLSEQGVLNLKHSNKVSYDLDHKNLDI